VSALNKKIKIINKNNKNINKIEDEFDS